MEQHFANRQEFADGLKKLYGFKFEEVHGERGKEAKWFMIVYPESDQTNYPMLIVSMAECGLHQKVDVPWSAEHEVLHGAYCQPDENQLPHNYSGTSS